MCVAPCALRGEDERLERRAPRDTVDTNTDSPLKKDLTTIHEYNAILRCHGAHVNTTVIVTRADSTGVWRPQSRRKSRYRRARGRGQGYRLRVRVV